MATKLSPREKAALATQMMNKAVAPSPTLSAPIEVPVRQINSVQIGLAMAGQGGKVAELEKQLHEAEEAVRKGHDDLAAVNAHWDGVLPARKFDPKLIKPSKWANRYERSFEGKEFLDLKEEISSAGGNVQAIKVRPIPGSSPQEYEIVFGHRRHKACLDLGVDVLAVVESIDDKELFREMDRENRLRADLRPYEQGLMYARALDSGLFASIRKLAEDVGADSTNASRVIALARWPDAVLDSFESRLDVQYRWIVDLNAALEKDPDSVLARAADILAKRKAGAIVSSLSAYAALIGKEEKAAVPKPKVIKVGGRVLSISVRNNKVSFELEKLAKDKLAKIEKFIAEVMAE